MSASPSSPPFNGIDTDNANDNDNGNKRTDRWLSIVWILQADHLGYILSLLLPTCATLGKVPNSVPQFLICEKGIIVFIS